MDSLTFSKIKEAIDKYTNISIVTRQDPSVDEMGAALSLYLSLKSSSKSLSIASPSNPLVEVSSLVGIDEVKTTLGAESGDLVVSFPYKEGEIEKVSYTRDDNFLNIVVKAGEQGLGFKEQDVQFRRGTQAPELLFVIGAPRVSDLGKLFDPAILKDTVVINIDNKAENQGYGDIVMVSPRLSSISEGVGSLILSLSLAMDRDIAQNLMLGIAVSTNNFQAESTSALAFEMAGSLMRAGALRPTVSAAPRRKMSMGFEERDLPSGSPDQNQANPFSDIQEAIKREEAIHQETLAKQAATKPTETPKTENPPEDWLEPKIYKGSTNF